MKRFEIGTIVNGAFAADTLGNDTELTTFATLAEAVDEIQATLALQPCGCDDPISDAAVMDSESGSIVWRQG